MANDIADLLLRIDASTEGLRRELKRAETAVQGGTAAIEKNTKKIDQSFSGMSAGVKKSLTTIGTALAAVGVSMSVSSVVRYADAWQNTTNQLKTVQKETENLADTQSMLMATANETRAGFETTANLYTRLSRSTESLNLSQVELIDLTETINKSFAVSGASATEASNAIIQLSQGLAAGALRGEEFNSVSEQSPILMQAIADHLKMTRGELRAFAAEGGITAEIVVKSLQEASAQIDDTFSKMSATFEQNMTVAKNNLLEFIGSSDAVQTVTSSTGAALVTLSENFDKVAYAAGIFATVLATRVLSAVVTSGAAAVTASAGMISLSSAMALLGGPVGVGILAAAGVYKLVDAYLEHNEAAREVEVASFLAQNGIKLTGEEFEGIVAKIDAATLSLRGYVEAGGALAPHIEAMRAELDAKRRALIEEKNATEDSTGATVESTKRTAEEIAALRKSAVALDHGTFSTKSKTDAVNELIESLSTVRMSYAENIAIINQATWTMHGVTNATDDAVKANKFWTAVSEDGAARRIIAEQNAARVAQDNWQRTHEYLSSAFVDIANNGGNAFDNIAKSFEQMIKRMVAEWAASKLMNLFGMGGGAGSGIGGALGGIIGGLGKSSMPGGVGGAVGVGAKIAGAAGSVGSAVSGAGSAALGALQAVPGWGWAIGGAALAAKLLDSSGTMSGNAGMLIRDVPGAEGRTFDVPAFASGFDPVGFARREDQGAATQVIDVFRADDAVLTALAKASGIDVRYGSNNFGGYDEKGRGNGLFFGTANEDGDNTAVPLDKQRDQFVSQWLKGLSGKVDQSVINEALAAGNADAMIARAAQLAGIDGSHAGGLNRVPFDGYIAELHAGERVLTKDEAKEQDAGMLAGAKLEMIKTARLMYTILQRWDFDGLPPERA